MAIPLDQTLFLMDIGCGSGLSGEILEELGHIWVGLDIAPSMLGSFPCCCNVSQILTKHAGTEVALERQVEGDLFLQDIGQGMGFRPGSFDGAIRFVPPPNPRPQPSSHRPLLMWGLSTAYRYSSGFSLHLRHHHWTVPQHAYLGSSRPSTPACAILHGQYSSSTQKRTTKSSS